MWSYLSCRKNRKEWVVVFIPHIFIQQILGFIIWLLLLLINQEPKDRLSNFIWKWSVFWRPFLIRPQLECPSSPFVLILNDFIVVWGEEGWSFEEYYSLSIAVFGYLIVCYPENFIAFRSVSNFFLCSWLCFLAVLFGSGLYECFLEIWIFCHL